MRSFRKPKHALPQSKGYDCVAVYAGGPLQFVQQRGLQVVRVQLHFTGGDLVAGGALEAKFAHANRVCPAADGRAENAASNGTRGIEVAGALLGVECRAGFLVCQGGEAVVGFVAFLQHAGHGVAREIPAKARQVLAGTLADALGAACVAPLEFGKAIAQAPGVELADRERADATLVAAGAAHQPCAALARGFGQCGIHNLDERGVGCHASRITRAVLPSPFFEAQKVRKVPLAESLRIIGRGSLNWLAERPIVVSFEVTDSCTCDCKHCDHGGLRPESNNLQPFEYRRYVRALRPCVVQVSGGEPLLRRDVVEIVRNIKAGSKLPYTILVSNWSLMTVEKYLELRSAGIDQFSVSLDFPDERHDDFRIYPGLYQHLEDLIPRLAKLGHDDIVLNSCITSENLGEIEAIADKAREWDVNLCYSAYSARRTGCRDYLLASPEQIAELNARLDRVEARRDATNWIVNSPSTLEATRRYFANGGAAGCSAGQRFLVVTADGRLQPCSMQFQRYRLDERKRMIREFTRDNRCSECYVSIRSYLDKSFGQLLSENVRSFLRW